MSDNTPLVSVITSTYRRPGLLTGRCVPSVQAQTWPAVEHVIISDEPDHDLRVRLSELVCSHGEDWLVPVHFAEMEEWVPAANSGVRARRRGLELARGELVTYLDDDDAFRPDHCALLAGALAAHPEAGFAYSQMASHGAAMEPAGGTVIGGPELGPCQVGTPMIMHRAGLTGQAGNWGNPDPMEDWKLVASWLEAGVTGYFVPVVTVDAWPSAYRGTLDEHPAG